VDKKAPDIAITPGSGDVYLMNAVVPAAYDCSDAGSGRELLGTDATRHECSDERTSRRRFPSTQAIA
jgi:hypothetical protein